MCISPSVFYIVIFILCFSNAYYITNNKVNEILNRSQRDPIITQTSALVNESKEVDVNPNILGDVWAKEGHFTDTYFNVLESLTANSLSDRSIKNDTKRSMQDKTLKQLKFLLDKKLKEVKNNKREVVHALSKYLKTF